MITLNRGVHDTIDLPLGTYIVGDIAEILGDGYAAWGAEAVANSITDNTNDVMIAQGSVGILGERCAGTYRAVGIPNIKTTTLIGIVPADKAVEGTGTPVEITGPVKVTEDHCIDINSIRIYTV